MSRRGRYRILTEHRPVEDGYGYISGSERVWRGGGPDRGLEGGAEAEP
jgi:hypothetical protein